MHLVHDVNEVNIPIPVSGFILMIVADSLVQADNPLALFNEWFDQWKSLNPKEPYAVTLATSDIAGCPAVRIVLARYWNEQGFTFFSNYESCKGNHLATNPQVSLLFYWMELGRQVRVVGSVKKIDDVESDSYFANRPRASQIGAWASLQSRPLVGGMGMLAEKVEHYTRFFQGKEVPRPDYWGGYRVYPHSWEFWQEGAARLHERIMFTPQCDASTAMVSAWKKEWHYP